MNSFYKIVLTVWVLLIVTKQYAQHHSEMTVEVNMDKKTLNIQQEITYFNESKDTLSSIILNDWMHGYSSKTTALAERFSDEFYRGFHLSKEEERGKTSHLTIIDSEKLFLFFERPEEKSDFIIVQLRHKLAPNQKTTLHLTYIVKIPNDQFTQYGYNARGDMNLKNWFLTPARYENHAFVRYNNNNLDDIANAVSNFNIELKVPKSLEITSDLNSNKKISNDDFSSYQLSGENRTDFSLFIEHQESFYHFKTSDLSLSINLKDSKTSEFQKAIIVERIVGFVEGLIGKYPHKKITISQVDYERNPFYGLNQLPSFISPFEDEFVYEIKFLKTYLNNYLKNSLRLDPRKDNWIYDGIQVYAMMKYIDEHHPDSKMLGSISNFKLLRNYSITNISFNEQYSYFYMLMARKNLDQPLGDPKNTLIKFNEQIASKYRSGLSFRYLDNYLDNNLVTKSIQSFYTQNKEKQVSEDDFEKILKSNTNKNIDWFFKTIIHSRDLIDYKFASVSKTRDSITFSIKNKAGISVPMPIYGIKKGNIVFKEWLETTTEDQIFTLDRRNADKIVLNYKNEVPEYNLRNNWKSLKSFSPNNRPLKFNFMKDLEDPYYNQILYVPTLTYNLYDGLAPGIRLHNKTLLDKPIQFEINPAYSTIAKTVSGNAFFAVYQNNRNSNLYNIRYAISGSYFHYAPNAAYVKINPMVQMRIREENLRDNRKQQILLRQVMVYREQSNLTIENATQSYSVFNIKYFNTKTEFTKHINLSTDFQMAGKFGKMSAELNYRKLFENNRQVNLRYYVGSFLFNNTNSDFFSFALDRPTDYLFDYPYYGRSESGGIFSQQYLLVDGGFKSKISNPYANQLMTTLNGSFSIWNWIEIYGDLGYYKNKNLKEKFVYDNGIRLNLVTNYFELYFPIYSNNGWEVIQNKYNEKIRFMIALDIKTLTNLFTRKWF